MSFVRYERRAFALALVASSLFISAPARAQSASPQPAPASPAADPWKGFRIRSSDGAFDLQLGAYIHADGTFFIDDGGAAPDAFQLRRVRPRLRGKVLDRYDFTILYDFAGSGISLLDAYLDIPLPGGVELRVGKTKAPVGLERLQSATALMFLERGLPTALVPNRDIGVLVHGELGGGRVEYAAGIFDGVVDGGSTDTNVDGTFDVHARLFVYPLATSELLAGWGIGVAGSAGTSEGSAADPQLARYRTPTGRAQIVRYLAGADDTDTTVADGARQRITAQTYLPIRRFALLGELVFSRQDVAIGSERATLTHRAWQVAATFLLTDDQASYRGVKPRRAFAPSASGWGGLELAARLGELRADDDTFPTFASPDASARGAWSWTAGVNWYLDDALKAQLHFERTTFDGGAAGGDRPAENLIAGRVQLVL